MPERSRWGRMLLVAALLSASALAVFATPVFAATGLNPLLPDAKSPNGKHLYDLYLHWITPFALIVFFLVEGLLLAIIFRFRRSRLPANYSPPQWHGNPRLELVWTVVPFLILVLIGYLSFRELQQDFVKPADSATDMDITVSGHQFGWVYTYPEGFKVDSEGLQASPMVIPTGKLVRLQMQSPDVIHSFWVPDLMGKTDNVPGYDNYTWVKVTEPGEWRGECAELCGKGHYTMQIRVKAVDQAEYDRWAAEQAAKAKATPTASGSTSASPGPSGGASPSPSGSGAASPSPAAGASASPSTSPAGSPRPSP